MLNVRHSVLPTMLYVDGMRRIARRGRDQGRMLRGLRDGLLRGFSTSRLRRETSGMTGQRGKNGFGVGYPEA